MERSQNPSVNETFQASKYLPYAGALLILVLTFLFYLPALESGFIWDDQTYITDNRLLLNIEGLVRIWLNRDLPHQYYPMVSTSFWIERHIFGLNPLGYHAVNIFLHALNSILVWFILSRLHIKGALIIALAFALHPVNVESVTFITERKNLLSGFFYLLAMLAYLKFDEGRSRWLYPLVLFSFMLALLSKTVACSLPVSLIIIDYLRQGELKIKRLVPLLPLFILGGVMGLFTIWIETTRGGAAGGEFEMAMAARVALAGKAAWFYIAKLFYPANLTFIYPRWEIDASTLTAWLYPLAVALLIAILFALRKKIGRGPIAGLSFFLITISPALGFFDIYYFVYSYVADHFVYLSALGVIAPTIGVAAYLLGKAGRAPVIALAVVVTVVLGSLAWSQNGTYKSAERLWQTTIERNPTAWVAYNNLGNMLFIREENTQAIKNYREAIRLKPDYAKAHSNLAGALSKTGRSKEAMLHYRESVGLDPFNAVTYTNMANALSEAGRYEEAVTNYRLSLGIDPESALTHYNLAGSLLAIGKDEEAKAGYRRAIALNADYAEAHNNLANILLGSGDMDGAERHYLETVSISPSSARAYNNLGIIMSYKKKHAESLEYLDKAIRLKPDYVEAHFNRGVTLAEAGLTDQALTSYKRAVELNPDYADAYNNIGSLLLRQERFIEAIEHYEKAARIDPTRESYKKNADIARRLKRSKR